MTRRTLVLGDLHLVRGTPAKVIDDLLALVAEHPGARLVFAGDLFDLSADHPGVEKARALNDAVEQQPRVRRALAEHVDHGGELWTVGGNHDAAIGNPLHVDVLRAALGLECGAAARVRSTPWFFREGGLHIEHGHLYDPDNATTHPLVTGVRSLGVHFVEEFIAPTGAFRYLNSNDGMPLELLLSAFKWYGVRGPFVVYKYFDAAFRAVLRSGPFFEGGPEGFTGSAREADFAQQHELPEALIAAMLELKAKPTMESLASTLQRLYLDRVAATLALLTGTALLAGGQRRQGATWLGLGALAMSISWALGHDRYGGSVPDLLASGAKQVLDTTGARLVVLGHAHREQLSGGYANTGSFSFPLHGQGRPFLEIEGSFERPEAALRHWKRAG